jgi:hypothetical protein
MPQRRSDYTDLVFDALLSYAADVALPLAAAPPALVAGLPFCVRPRGTAPATFFGLRQFSLQLNLVTPLVPQVQQKMLTF